MPLGARRHEVPFANGGRHSAPVEILNLVFASPEAEDDRQHFKPDESRPLVV